MLVLKNLKNMLELLEEEEKELFKELKFYNEYENNEKLDLLIEYHNNYINELRKEIMESSKEFLIKENKFNIVENWYNSIKNSKNEVLNNMIITYIVEYIKDLNKNSNFNFEIEVIENI